MIVILEILVSSIRVLLLFFGAVFTYILGEHLYSSINNALFTFSIPCMEMLSFIIALAGPVAYFFGIHHQKTFFQRASVYNKRIFFAAFLFGAAIVFLPVTGALSGTVFCQEQIGILPKMLQSLTAGVMTAFVAYLSFDIGVIQALYLTPVLRKAKEKRKK